MFDGLKRLYATKTQQKEAGLVPSIACGVISSFTGQMLAFPFEAISRRLQVICMLCSVAAYTQRVYVIYQADQDRKGQQMSNLGEDLYYQWQRHREIV